MECYIWRFLIIVGCLLIGIILISISNYRFIKELKEKFKEREMESSSWKFDRVI